MVHKQKQGKVNSLISDQSQQWSLTATVVLHIQVRQGKGYERRIEEVYWG